VHLVNLEGVRHSQGLANASRPKLIALWEHRGFIWNSAVADLRHRYAGSALGMFWNVLTPLAMMVMYTLIFSSIFSSRLNADRGQGAVPFALYLSAGFLPWAAFADGIMRGAQALLANATYLKKLPVPEHVFSAQAATSATFGMLIAVGLVVCLALALGQRPHWTWLLLPLVTIAWQFFGFGLGMFLGTLNTFFRDVGQILGVVLQLWMWSLPVVYPEDALPAAYRATLVFNPAYPFLSALRSSLLDGVPPAAWTWLAMLGWDVLAALAGYALLHRFRSELRDVL
jgi:lipopolysaccharide transport system permease protein